MRLLVVEDRRQLSDAITRFLQKHNITVDLVYDGLDGYHYIRSGVYDIVIMDMDLPSMNGIEIVKKIREEGMTTTILMLTNGTIESDVSHALESGVDDCMTTPFSMNDLLVKLQVLRKNLDAEYNQVMMSIGDIEFNVESGDLYCKDIVVHLTQLESKLFQLLLSQRPHKTSKEMILEALWNRDSHVDDNSVEVYISFLRKKLRTITNKVCIKTTRNVGYFIVTEEEQTKRP